MPIPRASQGARATRPRWQEALLDGEAETITRKAVELAKAGDLTAISSRRCAWVRCRRACFGPWEINP